MPHSSAESQSTPKADTRAAAPCESNYLERNLTLAGLVQSAQTGDEVSLTTLIHQFQPLVLSIAKHYYNVSREDAVQEGYVSLMECIMQFDATRGVPFTGYVNLKMRGDVRSAMRKIWRYEDRLALPKQDGDGNAMPDLNLLPSSCGEPVTDFEMAEWYLLIDAAGLTSRERLGIRSFVEGWSSTEIGRKTGVSAETVKTWRKRGIAKIRQLLPDIR